MTAQDRVRWDAYYRERKNQPMPAPDPLLLQWTPPTREGQPAPRALDGAAGFGQNGLWLAEQGYVTDIMEISRVALSRTRAEVAMRNLRNINLLQVDFDELELDEMAYDVACIFRYLKRDVMPQLKASVRAGGRIIYETFNTRYLGIAPNFNAHFLLELGELDVLFENWTILHSAEVDHVSQIVAIKPQADGGDDSADDALDW
ncbi:MAG: hypothetical protein EA396_01565 [Anaerolineaceae bacterium]|nr:MAG: hypothetical protein EA396_01565 [Anaerolineaceae bacterium]